LPRSTATVSDGEVENAVAVHVPDRHGYRIRANRIGLGGMKGAVAVAQQDTDRAVHFVVGHNEIADSVAVEVGHGHRPGIGPRGVSRRSDETGVCGSSHEAYQRHDAE
jgi:hypothetical protein